MSLFRDPLTHHLIGIEQAPAQASKTDVEFPKWVVPHPSHVVDTSGHISVADFAHHIDRAGKVTVLVKDAGEEAEALAEKSDKPRLRVVPDAPEDVSAGKPLSPLWPAPATEPAEIDPIEANHAAALKNVEQFVTDQHQHDRHAAPALVAATGALPNPDGKVLAINPETPPAPEPTGAEDDDIFY
ncbi:MAG TPA: hypothetical protein VKX28_26885 [Xanthobacteraceae bacterium]|nr:hypothetical protein [Xanthobacteraceae bacterium]